MKIFFAVRPVSRQSFVKIEKCSSHRAAKLDAEFAAIFALHGKEFWRLVGR
ncbi:TPA: hypothetical protein ACHGCJ_002113 [Escherichia coli]